MPANYNKDFAHLTGLERVSRIASGTDPWPGAARYLGYSFASVEEGQVRLSFEPTDEHLNFFQAVHGGVLAGLLDTAMGCAVITTLEAGQHNTIIDLHAKYLRPVMSGAGPFSVEAAVEHRGRRQRTMSAKIVDHRGKIYATATATGLII
jgi:uncharacterized protein (TIGR00369 family)